METTRDKRLPIPDGQPPAPTADRIDEYMDETGAFIASEKDNPDGWIRVRATLNLEDWR